MLELIVDYTANTLIIYGILLLTSTFFGILLREVILFFGNIYLKISKGSNALVILYKHLKGSFYVFLPLTFFAIFLDNSIEFVADNSILSIQTHETWIKTSKLLLIVSISWIFIKLLYFFEELVYSQYDIEKEDNYRERKIVTQLQFTRKVMVIVIIIITLSILFFQFDSLRNYGKGLLASAGIASVILGFAAQKSLGNLLAGIQIAFTQPIKIDDAVFVENEWGWIEEINLTYVVVKIWDLRRLVLPITYFVEKPFQNWTRKDAALLGSVFLYLDYRLPVEELRQELKRILDDEPLWDKKAWVLQVTDAKEEVMELRALMTAKNSPQTWELRCSVREKLLRYVATNYPNYLPVSRIRLNKEDD